MKLGRAYGATVAMALVAVGAARALTAGGFQHSAQNCFVAALCATVITMFVGR